MERQNLMIDADDTLWENNIHFERVIGNAQEVLQPFGVDPASFRARLNETELQHIPIYGYGTLNFTRSLVETFESVLPATADRSLVDRVRELAVAIMDQPLEILDGVTETLEYLSQRHSLFLVTKGDLTEQSAKVEKSGLRRHFLGVEVLPEKNALVYGSLLKAHAWHAEHTWMVGNSLRSDVIPALEAGINAIFIPHPHTWILEHADPVEHARLLELERFSDLRNHF